MKGKARAEAGLQGQGQGQSNAISPMEGRCRIEDFIRTQVTGRGLDERTEKAYRQDLEHFYQWMEQSSEGGIGTEGEWSQERKMENYLTFLSRERGLRTSTIIRKHKVFTYYLSYLVQTGSLPECRALILPAQAGTECKKPRESGSMSKYEVDALFQAAEMEYKHLDSDFRKRVCLRDLVMLELLFYHRIEVSELLRLEASDYDRRTGTLFLCRKRGKERKVYVFSKLVRGHMEKWLGERDYFERDNEYHNRMFLSKLGRPLSMKMVINVVDKYRQLAGIQKAVTPKDLKNSMERYGRELVMERCS